MNRVTIIMQATMRDVIREILPNANINIKVPMTLSLVFSEKIPFLYKKQVSCYLQSVEILSEDRCFPSTMPAIPRQLFCVPYDTP